MSILTFISDLIIIALCCGVAAYCRIVHKRLEALRDLDSGLGAVIGRLNNGVADMQSSFDATRKSVGRQGDQLRDVIDEGSSLADYLHRLIRQAEAAKSAVVAAPEAPAVAKPSKKGRSEPRLSEAFLNDGDPLAGVEPLGFEEMLKRRQQKTETPAVTGASA